MKSRIDIFIILCFAIVLYSCSRSYQMPDNYKCNNNYIPDHYRAILSRCYIYETKEFSSKYCSCILSSCNAKGDFSKCNEWS